MTSGSPARIAVAGTSLAGDVDIPANAPESVTGIAPRLPKHNVDGRLIVLALGASEKWNRLSTGASSLTDSTVNCTVFDERDRRWTPESHSTVAVLVIIFG